MRFLLDVHIGTSFARALSERGYDVVRAALSYPEWDDDRLLALAVADELIIITQDSDFTDLIYAFGHVAPSVILYLRCEPEVLPYMVERVLQTLEKDRFLGHMAVIRPADIRYRLLPRKSDQNG